MEEHNERRCSMIKIQNLTAGYGKTIVLSHINLELKNETYGIIGPNGSGKTTLFRVLTNSLKLKSGHISKINGVCGYLPQKFGCMPLLTVKEQLQYFCYLKKIPVAEENEEICRKYSTPRFFPGCLQIPAISTSPILRIVFPSRQSAKFQW